MEQFKVAIVSDTHGNWKNTAALIEQETKTQGGITHLVFLGDHAKDGVALAEYLQVPAYIVRGNCDATEDGVEEQIVALGDWRLLICHGHRYQVKQTLQNLYYRGLELGVDYALFGHTHIAIYEVGDVILINPGSMCERNMACNSASWGLLTLPVEKNEKNLGKYEKNTCQT